MKLSQIVHKFGCTVYTKDLYDPEKTIDFAFCSDLMSDALMIMSTVKDGETLRDSVLITGLTTNQSIRTAEMLDVEVVLLVRGKIPAEPVIELARESGIVLLGTNLTMFNVSGLMYQEGIQGISLHK
ncbi:MAG TPA: hypothetical protein P5154_05335 [Candidatus Izemoplasmatales bacterium]|nr:hypothetical protein [Candidatus Izemoplasmatales bacterium]